MSNGINGIASGPADPSLTDRYGRFGAAVGVGVLGGWCDRRMGSAWRVRADKDGLIGSVQSGPADSVANVGIDRKLTVNTVGVSTGTQPVSNLCMQ
jgi:hypothetical protein